MYLKNINMVYSFVSFIAKKSFVFHIYMIQLFCSTLYAFLYL